VQSQIRHFHYFSIFVDYFRQYEDYSTLADYSERRASVMRFGSSGIHRIFVDANKDGKDAL